MFSELKRNQQDYMNRLISLTSRVTPQPSRIVVISGILLTMALLALVGCDELVDVPSDQQTIDTSQPVTLEALMIGATSDLFTAYDSKIVWGGLFSDTFVSSGTAPRIQIFDRRAVTEDHGGGGARGNSIGGPFYTPQQKAVRVAELAQERLLNGEFDQIADPQNSAEFARFSAYNGFGKAWIADLYCTAAFNGDGPELSSDEVYQLAEQEFTLAIEAENAEESIRQASLAGRARVRLILGNTDGALTDAEQVNEDLEFVATYSTNSFAERNRVHFRTWDFRNWSVGPAFRGLTIDDSGEADPRVDLAVNPEQAFDPSQDLYAPQKVSNPNSPLVITSGDEAQYIIAEIVGGTDAIDIINDVRARNGVETMWSPSNPTATEIRDKVIDERKRTLFLEGVRLGDIRRYLDLYDLDFFQQETPQGFTMGSQTCLPLPEIERNNNPGI